MDVRKAKNYFYQQKRNAKQRGIEFLFTFEEWVKWWEDNLGADWQSLRGKGKNLYQMTRYKDEGSYEWGNVGCKTHQQNSQEKFANGKVSKGNTGINLIKLTNEQVVYIRESDLGCISLAQKFEVDRTTIWRIKTCRRRK